jgi:hypothetical protein
MVFPHADGSPEESLLKRIAKELRYDDRHTERYARLTVAIRELSDAYCAAVDAQRRTRGISVSDLVRRPGTATTGRRSTSVPLPRESTNCC